MMSRVWKRTRIELVEPASGKQAGWQLLAVNGYPAFPGYMDKEIWGQEFISWRYLIGNASLDGQLATFLMISY